MEKRISIIWRTIVLFALFAEPVDGETVDPNTSTGQLWSARRFEREFCGKDTWEPFNRTMFGITDWCMDYVCDPFCRLYSSIIPKPLIKGIDNFCENLEDPCRIFANLFMGEWRPAWDETRRFVINSTLGIGGLFDPAEDLFYIFESDASLSDTFAAWGIPAGPPLALPFCPRASLRGNAGYLLDYAFDLKTWLDFVFPSPIYIGYTWALVPNKAPVWRGRWESFFGHANDSYSVYMPLAAAVSDFGLQAFVWNYQEERYNAAAARLRAQELPEGNAERKELEARAKTFFKDVRPPVHASAARPAGLLGEWREIPGFAPRGPALDSMRALCLSPLNDDDFWWERRSIFNRDFSKSIDSRSVSLDEEFPKAVYSFVAAPEADGDTLRTEKLAIILPGIGAGRTASEAVALAEMLHAQGYGVVICNSLFHWEHLCSVNRDILPGYLTEDVRRFADFLARILDDLKSDELVTDPEISVLGWSMGGLTTAHMAAMDDRNALPITVRRFIAINPPASLEHALAQFIPVYESSRNWTREHAYQMLTEVSQSLSVWATQDHPRYDPANPPTDEIGDPWDYAPNISERDANYLLGQTMRIVFKPLIARRHQISPFPWIKSELTWFHRNDFYDEIENVSMDEYIRRYVPTCYTNVTAETMIATADIRNLEPSLVRNKKLSVLHSWNDPLEDDADRRWFDRTFGERITWFADGGHCGYFYTKPFADELLRRLAD